MRIGLNSQKMLALNTGVGNYTYNLVKHLLEVDDENFYCFFFFNQLLNAEEILNGKSNRISIHNGAFRHRMNPVRILWEQFVLPGHARRSNVDVFHYIDHNLSLVSRPCPTVITVHDLAFLRLPEMYNFTRRTYKRMVGLQSVKHASAIIAISEYTKSEILELTGVEESKIEVIPYGVDSIFRVIDEAEELAAFRRKRGLPERFILFVGTLQPRKNIDGLLHAYRLLRRESDLDHHLVICGDRGWLFKKIFALVGELGLSDSVAFLDYVPHFELPLLYNNADLFVYPSWFEGFGLPPLEAMACGTPVVSSNVTSLPEVVSDAGITVDPGDIEALAGAMKRALTEQELRQTMRRCGLERASGFSWEKNARRTLEVYRRAGNGA